MKINQFLAIFLVVIFQSCKDEITNNTEIAPKKTCLLVEETNGYDLTHKYSYDKDGRITAFDAAPNVIVKYSYDSLNRIEREEVWINEKLEGFNDHHFDASYLIDSVSSQWYSLDYVLNLNEMHLPIERNDFGGNAYSLHRKQFIFDSLGNMTSSADMIPNDPRVHIYTYDNKKSPYPKIFNQYIPTNLSNNNVLEDYDYFTNEKYFSYRYIYNSEGYPLKKVTLKYDGYGRASAIDTITFVYSCK